METTPTTPTADADALDIARNVESLVAAWKAADPATREGFRSTLKENIELGDFLEDCRAPTPANLHWFALWPAVAAEIEKLDAADKPQAEQYREQQRLQELSEAQDSEDDAFYERTEEWFADNVDSEWLKPFDLAALHPNADPALVRELLRDGVPHQVDDADEWTWKDAHREGVDYGCNWFIHGPSGVCKTRIAWHLAIEHVLDSAYTEEVESFDPDDCDKKQHERRIVVTTVLRPDLKFWSFHDWTRAYAFAQQSEGAKASYGNIIRSVGLVVLDEFDPHMSHPQAVGFLDLLKARFDRGKRLIITSMFPIDRCIAVWDADPELRDWGGAVKRRVVDNKRMTGFYLGRDGADVAQVAQRPARRTGRA
jgi:hypothetical protein